MEESGLFAAMNGWLAVAASLGVLVLAAALGRAGHVLLFRLLGRICRRSGSLLTAALVRRWRRPAGWLLPLAALVPALSILSLAPQPALLWAQHLLELALIAVVAWLISATVLALRDRVLQAYDLQAEDNLRARAVHTQVDMLAKIALVVIVVLAAGAMLMTFDAARQVGMSLLASAGIAGVILGFAAQKSLATLVAGIQIALTQPIRIDDVVVVEGEWGRIEEITLTYVVVRIWDLRRLILPVTYFLEKPFQNWTRVSADILGAVPLYADYRVPVEALRQELERIVEGEALWDGKVAALQMVGLSEKTVELRALISARDSGSAWELRCLVREKLIAYLRRHHPECLPRLRAEVESENEAAGD